MTVCAMTGHDEGARRWVYTDAMDRYTARLRLVAQTAALAQAESDRVALAQLLGAEVPASWPPAEMRTALGSWAKELREIPELAGWVSWYWLAQLAGRQVLIGCGGFKGLPAADGSVEVGYATLAEHQRRGYAAEALAELLRWAFADRRVRWVDAETHAERGASVRLLDKLGFRRLPAIDPEVLRYRCDRPA